MEIEVLRDLVITISGIVVTLAAILLAISLSPVYSNVNSILKSVKTTVAKMEALTSAAGDELGKPVIQAAGLIQGIACGIREIGKIFRKGG
ncbi:hypothetical protein ACFLYL_02380 [Chloroflexota bacterium]